MNLLVPKRGTNLLRLAPEVINRTLLVGQDLARGNENVVNTDTLTAVRKPQRVIKGRGRLVVGKAVEIPVCVATQHDGRLLSRRQRHHPDVPGHVLHRVGDVRGYFAGESFFAIRIDDAKCNARS